MGGEKRLSDDETTLRVSAEDLLDHEKAALDGLAGPTTIRVEDDPDVHSRRTDVESLPLPLEFWVEVSEALTAGAAYGFDAEETLQRFGLTMAQFLDANQWWRKRVDDGLVEPHELATIRETYRAKYR